MAVQQPEEWQREVDAVGCGRGKGGVARNAHSSLKRTMCRLCRHGVPPRGMTRTDGKEGMVAQRIMVINDTPEILDMFRLLLEEEAGYEVVLYSYAVMDMREIERHAPDLILLDYIFGGEAAGWQLLQKLKMSRATAKIPLIICTAATNMVQEIAGYLRAHGIAVVPKPFEIDELLDAVKRALEVSATHDATLAPDRADHMETEEGADEADKADEANDS